MRAIKALSFDSCVTDLHFLEASLLAEPSTEGLAQIVTEMIDRGHMIRMTALESERGRVRAQAKARRADFHLDSAIAGYEREVRVEIPDVRSEAYKGVFDNTVRQLTRFALRTQLGVSKKLRTALELSKLSSSLKTKWQTQLLSLEAAGGAALEVLDDAELEVFKGQRAVREFKTDADAIRGTVYGTLMATAPSHVAARDWAESFFYVHDSRVKADEDVPADAPATPAPPA